MKTFNASDLAHKRTEIFNAAKAEGAILQKKNTNGVVLEEFVITIKPEGKMNIKNIGRFGRLGGWANKPSGLW
jgi:hypothetical protein